MCCVLRVLIGVDLGFALQLCVCVCFGGILVRVLLNNCLGFDRG